MSDATFDLSRAHRGLDRILVWVTITLDGTRYPWAGVAIADPVEYEDGYKAARLLLVEDIVLALSDRTGRMQATKAVFTLSDIPDPITGDTVIRKWLGEGKTLRGATIDIKFLTDAQRRAGAVPRVAFRGRVDRYQGPAGFQARLECQGIVGSRLDQPVVGDTIGRHFSTAPAPTAGLPLPIALGVLSDASAASPRGSITPVYSGDFPDPLTAAVWSVLAYAAHACDISTPPDLFVVDNSTGVVTPVDSGSFGSTWAVAGRTGYATYWGSTPYYTDGLGHRWMIISVRGPDGFSLSTGATTLRANVLGAEAVGDCSGTVITNLFDQLALLVDNLTFLQDESALGGDWLTSPPAFEDATPKRDVDSFTLAKDNADVVLPEGSEGARFISEPITYGDLIAEILRSAAALAGTNAAGQFQVVVANPAQEATATVTEVLEVLKDSFAWQDDDQGFANALSYAFNPAYETAGSAPTMPTPVTLEDDDSQTRYKERKVADTLTLLWRLSSGPAAAVATLALAASRDLPRQAVLSSGIHWATLKLGDIIALTHREGPVAGGWVEQRLLILGQSIGVNDLQVAVTCVDFRLLPTTTDVDGLTTDEDEADQDLSVSADVTGSVIDEGRVRFTITDDDGVTIGAPVTFDVVSGTASGTYVLPGGTPAATYTLTARYLGTSRYAPSRDTAAIVVSVPDFHTDTHDDVAHSDSAHADVAHADVAHSDSHGDGHGDTAHSDTAHSDTAHADTAHADTAHTDVSHADVTHADVAHSDVAHSDTDHADTAHDDTAHDDSHGDTPHGDSAHDDAHGDVDHTDEHGDHSDAAHPPDPDNPDVIHADTHDDVEHEDTHGDTAHSDAAHADSHDDTAHADTEHADTAHADVTHADVTHADTAHADTAHSDTAHADTAHSDTAHADVTHADVAHSDASHDDSHGDTAHSDTAHSDVAHGDTAHGDSHVDEHGDS